MTTNAPSGAKASTSRKAIIAKMALFVTDSTTLNLLAHEIGMDIIRHADTYGDCTLALDFAKAMPASWRRSTFVQWVAKYTPIRVKLQTKSTPEKVGMLKEGVDKGYAPFDLVGADKEPFYMIAELVPERTDEYDFAKLVALAKRLPKLIGTKIADGKVPAADIMSAKGIMDKLNSLSFERVDLPPVPANTDTVTPEVTGDNVEPLKAKKPETAVADAMEVAARKAG